MATTPRMFGPFVKVSDAESQAAFDEANAALPTGFNVFNVGDAADQCPGPASRAKLTALRQRSMDARSVWMPLADQLREQRIELQKAQSHRTRLTQHRMWHGFELGSNAQPVMDIQAKIDRVGGEVERLRALEEHRSAAMNNVATLLRRCEGFLSTAGGKLAEAPIIEPNDVLKRGEKLVDAVERLRFSLRQLDASRHQIESAPYPSADAKHRLREQIENLAMRAVPDVSGPIEHNTELLWPQKEAVLGLVAIGGKDGERIIGNAMGEVPDVIGLFCWLLRPQLLKAVEALVDAEADDSSALSAKDRAAKLAEIARDRMLMERHLAALIWHGQSNGDAVEHAADASPLAALGIETR